MSETRRGCRRRDPDLQNRLGIAVRVLRQSEGLTQFSLAQSAGITQSAISLVEKGERIDISTLHRIALALNMKLSKLVSVAEDVTKEQVSKELESFLNRHLTGTYTGYGKS